MNECLVHGHITMHDVLLNVHVYTICLQMGVVSYTDFIALAPSRQTVLWAIAKLISSDWMAYVIARHHANLITTVSIGHSIN